MDCAGRNFYGFSGAQMNALVAYNHRCFTAQDIKELPRFVVQMFHFKPARRHTFLYNTEVVAFQQMPAVAIFAPGVMLCVIGTDDVHNSFSEIALLYW